ncbi:CAP domain-containing protein [Syncephalis plumigaleata]|nr:CAP domain-containing protein [Syncephalis plumigaleata]
MPLPQFGLPFGARNAKPTMKQNMKTHTDWVKTAIINSVPSLMVIVMIIFIHGVIMVLLTNGLESAGANADDRISRQLLCSVNEERMRMGLPALGIDSALTRAAQVHSDAQARVKQMSHRLSGERAVDERIDDQKGDNTWWKYGENVAYGYTEVSIVMEKWMKSPGHRANILGNFTHFGGAVAYSHDKIPYWSQEFGHNGMTSSFPLCPLSPTTPDKQSSAKKSDSNDATPAPNSQAPTQARLASADTSEEQSEGNKTNDKNPVVKSQNPTQPHLATATDTSEAQMGNEKSNQQRAETTTTRSASSRPSNSPVVASG